MPAKIIRFPVPRISNYQTDGTSALATTKDRQSGRRVIHDRPVDKATLGRQAGEGEREEARQAAETERVRASLEADLLALGLSQARDILAEYEWLRVAYALTYVEAEVRKGEVRKPAGLLVWRLKHPPALAW